MSPHRPFIPPPPARVVARRSVDLPLGRRLDITAVQDGERADLHLRIYTRGGHVAGNLFTRQSVLPAIAAALTDMASALGVTTTEGKP